eukprot:jgi/Undpi1/9773/HiC_scaffold_27.g12229.m1
MVVVGASGSLRGAASPTHHHHDMRTSKAFVVFMAAGCIDGTMKRGLSFSPLSPVAVRQGSFQREQSLGIHRTCQHSAISTQGGSGTTTATCGDTAYRRRSSSSSALSSTVGLPSLDGLPGAASSASSAGSVRSRRGKYPVVELWRRETEHDPLLKVRDEGNCLDDGYDDDLVGGPTVRVAARGSQHTALEHLRVVLDLGPEQVESVRESFPALDEVDPEKLDLRPKLLFLRETMGGDGGAVAVSFPQFFGHPLERHIAPRHAFLVASGRPSGATLMEGGCRGLRRMLELPANRFVAEMVPGREMSDYRRFEQAFLRGPFDAARRGDADTLTLLRSHGWDCWETDRRGRTALFWAAGGGSVSACVALTEGDGGLCPRDSGGDGSTPLHWAAAGVEARRFGTGGDVDVCRWLLGRGADPGATTTEGNTVVMWAAWAGGLDATRWAVEEAGADLDAANVNGCSVAHWAASGGDEEVCRYLRSKGVDFTRRNKGGNDPLNHAVAYGRRHIAAWLLGEAERSSPPGGGEGGAWEGTGRRRNDQVLLDLARLTGDEKMLEFLTRD